LKTHPLNSESEPHSNPSSRFNRGSWAILALGIGAILASIWVFLYRVSLPTDGFSFNDDSKPGILIDDNLNRILTAVDGIPTDEIIRGAVMLNPIQPEKWEDGKIAEYTFGRLDIKSHSGFSEGAQIIPEYTAKYVIQTSGYTWPASTRQEYLFLLMGPLFLGLGLLIFLKQPQKLGGRIIFLFGAFQVAKVVTSLATNFWGEIRLVDYFYLGSFWPTLILLGLGNGSFALLLHLLLVYPQPKRILVSHPRWVLALIYATCVFLILNDNPAVPLAVFLGEWADWINLSLILSIILSLIITTIHSLKNLRDPYQRDQFRWIGWPLIGLGALMFTLLLLYAVYGALQAQGWASSQLSGLEKFTDLMINGSFLIIILFPVFLAIGIWRNQLFDVNLIIRRTVIYGLLTLILSGVYFSSVVLLQNLFRTFTGQNNQIAVVGSTLAIAGLFTPLRRRLQVTIDKHFSRRPYNPEEVLAALAQTTRNEVDIEALSKKLLHLVDETMEPDKTSLWLVSNPARRNKP